MLRKPLSALMYLNFNRSHFDVVEAYIEEKERTFADCHNDPLFSQIPIVSAKRKLAQIKSYRRARTKTLIGLLRTP